MIPTKVWNHFLWYIRDHYFLILSLILIIECSIQNGNSLFRIYVFLELPSLFTRCYEEMFPFTLVESKVGQETTRFPVGSWWASSAGTPASGVSPRLFCPRESRSFQAHLCHIRVTSHLLVRTAGPFTSLKPGLARGLRDSRGVRSLGETPQRAKANEEASQLPAGKRVVPEQARPLVKHNGPFLLKYLTYKGVM